MSVTNPEVYHGHKTVGTTRAPLTTLQYPVRNGVLLRCPGTGDPVPNTACVWVGGSGVTANSDEGTGGIPLPPGAAITIPIDDPTKLWVVSTNTNQDIAYILV